LKPLKRTRDTPIYSIGAASRLCGLPVYTLRWIEAHGLVAPKRTRGKHRLYSEADADALSDIRQLLARKVNLAGIRVILEMRREAVRRP
jgi:DNA-binding transcriptional MerR regulator